jgi:ribonucleoside-diphosphate reductase alpha chain
VTLSLEEQRAVTEAVPPKQITKRDGRVVDFDATRIRRALALCFTGVGKYDAERIDEIAGRVVMAVSYRDSITVEQVQDIVEVILQAAGEYAAAKHYILYRAEHAKQRAERPVPDDMRALFESSATYFPTQLQQFQFFDKYSRFDYDKGRRETWEETVNRSVDFLHELVASRTRIDLGGNFYDTIRRGMLDMRAMPSMRLLAMAGPAARRDNSCIYNCTYLPISDMGAFAETLLLSMAGCGVGFSVESRYVEQFPRVSRQNTRDAMPYLIDDSTEGWAQALLFGLECWFSGWDAKFNYDEIRPAGTPLRTKGGRASGPEPLRKMLDFTRARILARQGRTLRTIDAHDIACMVGSAAVSGGMRRTAMISLFDFDDTAMRLCKSGDFERENSQRWNANNSAVWPDEDLDQLQVIEQVMDMVKSQRGEPGIFNLRAVRLTLPERRTYSDELRTNPCGEIILPPYGMCNLSIAVARAGDTLYDLRQKVELAAQIGTIQSLATHFPNLRADWKSNCERERLLGVDITGQLDCIAAQVPEVQRDLRRHAVDVNKRLADVLGINQAASVTCVKPSGNSSQLLDCSSGLHARWSKFYERNVRVSAHGTLYKVLRDAGVPMDPENGQFAGTANTYVAHFVVKAPDRAITRDSRTALEQCRYWLQCKREWTEHNPSVTITYAPDEIAGLITWIWENRDVIGGMAFLPINDAKYAQLPYIEIDEAEYERRAAAFPTIDFSKIYRYESVDLTTAAQELACLAGVCEVE